MHYAAWSLPISRNCVLHDLISYASMLQVSCALCCMPACSTAYADVQNMITLWRRLDTIAGGICPPAVHGSLPRFQGHEGLGSSL